MAAVNGIGGDVSITASAMSDAVDLNVRNWSIDYTADGLDSTDFTTAGPRTFIAGLTSWNGSYEALLDGTTSPEASDMGATVTLTLTASTGRIWSGSALILGMHPAVNVDGINTITVDFQGTGAIGIA